MHSIRFCAVLVAVAFLACGSLEATVIQSVAGPQVASGGTQNVLIDTTSDTGNWMDDWNAGTAYFFGFDWTVDNNAGETGTGGFFGGLNLYNGGGERAGVGNSWAPLDYSPFWPGHTSQGSTGINYVVGNTVRLVAEIDIDTDSIKVWVNPTSGDFATPDGTTSARDLQTITRICHRAGNGPGQATLANLVVADTFASAVGQSAIPEPATMCALGLAVAGLGGYSRKRRRG